MYSWMDVARRTEAVYDRVRQTAVPTFAERLARYNTVGGTVAGWLCCFTVTVMYLVWGIVEWVWPREGIELARDFPSAAYLQEAEAEEEDAVGGSTNWEYEIGPLQRPSRIR